MVMLFLLQIKRKYTLEKIYYGHALSLVNEAQIRIRKIYYGNIFSLVNEAQIKIKLDITDLLTSRKPEKDKLWP